jgi:hypothetical protein
MMLNRRLCKLSSCGIVLPGSNGCSRNRDRLEAMAAAAQPSEVHHFDWAGLSSKSRLTEAQEDLVDHWSPQRVIDDSHAKRALLVAAQTWAEPFEWACRPAGPPPPHDSHRPSIMTLAGSGERSHPVSIEGSSANPIE